ATAPPREQQRGGAVRGAGQGRPGGEPARAGRRGGGLPVARVGGRGPVPRGRAGGALRAEGPATPGRARLQREEARLPQLPAVLPGGGHRRGGGPAMERTGRRLPVERQVAAARLTRPSSTPA